MAFQFFEWSFISLSGLRVLLLPTHIQRLSIGLSHNGRQAYSEPIRPVRDLSCRVTSVLMLLQHSKISLDVCDMFVF